MSKVSVYIPTYNYSRYINQAIESVLYQTFKDWELIIVNDGSTDNTKELLQKYESDKRIKILHQENNGLTTSCNTAIKISTGEYIIRLDADDYFDENALMVLSTILDTHPNVGLVYPDYYHIDENGNIIEQIRRKKVNEEVKLLDLPAHGAGTMIRYKCLNELNFYNEDIKCQDCYDLWIKFINKFDVYNVNLPLFYYRRHNLSLTQNAEKILATRRFIKNSYVKGKLKGDKLKVLGLIPARSKSNVYDKLPLKKLGDKPLIAYIIQEALKTELLDKIIVTTEDDEIAKIAKEYNSEIILRPENLALPNTHLEPTIFYIIDKLKEKNYSPDIIAVLHVNSPFVKSEHITEAINTLLIFDVDSIISVCEDLKFHYQHDMYGLRPLFKKRLLRLEKESLYEENGAIYVSKKDVISQESFLGKKIGHIIMTKEESIHIDSKFDFWMAEQIIESYKS